MVIKESDLEGSNAYLAHPVRSGPLPLLSGPTHLDGSTRYCHVPPIARGSGRTLPFYESPHSQPHHHSQRLLLLSWVTVSSSRHGSSALPSPRSPRHVPRSQRATLHGNYHHRRHLRRGRRPWGRFRNEHRSNL